MNDVVMGDIAADTLDGRRFAHVIRKSVHDVVEGTLAKAGGNADARQDIRAAGERLGDALIAYADGGERPARHVPTSTVTADPELCDDADGRARAFRTMAGVRV
jgi:hypothetical protein